MEFLGHEFQIHLAIWSSEKKQQISNLLPMVFFQKVHVEATYLKVPGSSFHIWCTKIRA